MTGIYGACQIFAIESKPLSTHIVAETIFSRGDRRKAFKQVSDRDGLLHKTSVAKLFTRHYNLYHEQYDSDDTHTVANVKHFHEEVSF